VKNTKIFQNLSNCSTQPAHCEIHESDFNNGLIFQVTYPFMKYTKVISTFNIGLIVMGDLLHYEIYESDFNNGLIFQVIYSFVKKTWKFFNIDLVVKGDLPNCEKYEDFLSGLIFVGDLPRWKNKILFMIGPIFPSDLPVCEKTLNFFQYWYHCNDWPTHRWKIQRFFSLV
jgi:hypothetical protein